METAHSINQKEENIMNKQSLLAAAIMATVSTGLVITAATPVIAAETQTQSAEKSADKTQADQDLIKVSEDARMTMRNVDGARIALFNGMPDKAQIYADAAVTRASAALNDADKYAMDTKASKKDGQKYLPFDAGLSVAEMLEPTKVKREHAASINRHLHSGVTRKNVEALKVEGVNVAITTDLLPIKTARSHIEDAARLIGKGKYYEANLALKAVEDSVVTEVFDSNAIPKDKSSS